MASLAGRSRHRGGVIRPLRRALCGRRRPQDDQGFSLVEVVIGMGLFAILATVALGTYTKTADLVKSNRDRVAASGLVAAQTEAARGLDISALTAPYTTTQTVNGTTFTVTRSTNYVDELSNASLCTATSLTSVQLLVTVTVTWPNMGNVAPIKSNTLKVKVSGAAIALSVLGAAGQAIAGIPVTLNTGATATTDSTGCAVFTDLAGGAYTVSANVPGYVGTNNSQVVSTPATATSGQLTQVQFNYDQARSLVIKATDPNGAVLNNTAFNKISDDLRAYKVMNGATQVGSSNSANGTVTGLYPGTYTITSGNCTMATTDLSNANGTTSIPYGYISNLSLLSIGSVYATFKGTTTNSVSCPNGTVADMGTVFGFLSPSADTYLPYGKWTITKPFGFIPITSGTFTVNLLNPVISLLGF